MTKKILTLPEKYEKYNGQEFTVRLTPNDLTCIKTRFIICGYVKENNNFLIGRLIKNQGITEHFKKPKKIDIIAVHKEDNQYVYVNIRCIESYPTTKNVVRKKTRVNDIIDINEIEF